MSSSTRPSVRTFASFVRLEHTVFALPWAYVGMVLAAHSYNVPITGPLIVWMTLAMVGARSLAMALNRIIDRSIDAQNPRTAVRELPSGALSVAQAWAFCAVAAILLIVATWQLDPAVRWLWPVPVALFVLYPYTKRFTWLCHLVLGISIGLAPVGAWAATSGTFDLSAWLIGGAVALWIAGFDVIYACQDVAFDRSHGLHSLPARWGITRALLLARIAHVCVGALLVTVGAHMALGPVYWAGLGVVLGLLAWEHSLVKADDLSRVTLAFFTINGVVAIVYGAATITASFLAT